MSEEEAFAIVKTKARDNSRVPMHWDDSKYAGFSQVTPWLCPTDQDRINVEKELASGELISDGHIQMVLKDDPQVLGYERYLDGRRKKLLVLTNFYGSEHEVALPEEVRGLAARILISNYGQGDLTLPEKMILKLYEALVVKVEG